MPILLLLVLIFFFFGMSDLLDTESTNITNVTSEFKSVYNLIPIVLILGGLMGVVWMLYGVFRSGYDYSDRKVERKKTKPNSEPESYWKVDIPPKEKEKKKKKKKKFGIDDEVVL